MIIEAWSEKIARSIKNTNENITVSIPVMKFALIIIINFTIPVVVSLLIGLWTGKFLETLTAITFFVVLRLLSGGFHFQSPIPCMITMVVITAVPPHVSLPDMWSTAFTIAALILAALLAPSNLRGYHTMPEKYYPLMKAASVLLIYSNFFFHSSVIASVFLIQGILLFRWKEV
jgi:accessory gene regulator B